MNALKEPFTLTLTQFSSADSISTHSRHLTSNINTFQAESNNNKSIHSLLIYLEQTLIQVERCIRISVCTSINYFMFTAYCSGNLDTIFVY